MDAAPSSTEPKLYDWCRPRPRQKAPARHLRPPTRCAQPCHGAGQTQLYSTTCDKLTPRIITTALDVGPVPDFIQPIDVTREERMHERRLQCICGSHDKLRDTPPSHAPSTGNTLATTAIWGGRGSKEAWVMGKRVIISGRRRFVSAGGSVAERRRASYCIDGRYSVDLLLIE